MTGLEIIELAMANIDILAPGSDIQAMTSTEFKSEIADMSTGKAVAWQFYFYKPSGDKYISRIVNVAENGGYIVRDDHEVVGDDPWDYESANIDTDALPGIIATHQETQDWLNDHPNVTLDIQTSSGPLFGTEELSWLLWYKTESESHQVHISALDGHILE